LGQSGQLATIESSVTGLRELLRISAEQRPPDRHIESIERLVDRGVVRDIVEIEFKDLAQFAKTPESIFRFAVAVVVFEPISVNDEMLPAGKPTFGGLARVGPQRLYGKPLTVPQEVEEIHFRHIGLPRLRPYRCDGLSRRRTPIRQSRGDSLCPTGVTLVVVAVVLGDLWWLWIWEFLDESGADARRLVKLFATL